MTTIKLKNGSGAPTSGDLAQGEPALDLTNKRLYTEDSGGTVIEVGTNPGVDVTFADNRKAVFGAGSDLQIYHDGSSSYISDVGTGNLRIKSNGVATQILDGSSLNLAVFNSGNGQAQLYNVNSGTSTIRLATTSTGIDVTGTVTADGLTVDGAIAFTDSGSSNRNVLYLDGSNNVVLATGTTAGTRGIDLYTNNSKSLSVAEGGDISFYEDTGTTAKLFWDASAEQLQLTAPVDSPALNIKAAYGTATERYGAIKFENTSYAGANSEIRNIANGASYVGSGLGFFTSQHGSGVLTQRMTIDRYGNIKFGATGGGYISGTAPNTYNSGYSQDNDSWATWMNYNGYQDGASRYRDFIVGNGKQGRIATFDGSSGNVGIGTSSPTSGGGLTLSSSTTGQGFIDFKHTVDGDSGFIGNAKALITGATTNQLGIRGGTSGIAFGIGSSEAMRLDSSGNLLVGTTDTTLFNNSTGGGFSVSSNGFTQIAKQGVDNADPVLILNQTGLDGEIQRFYKDGSIVGSIGTASSYITIGSPVGSGGHLLIGNNLVHPATSTGGAKDAVIDLGGSSNRFKDLYLSGATKLFSGTNSPVANSTLGDVDFGARTDGTVTARIRGIAGDNGNGTDGQLTFYTADNTASQAAEERMRLDSSGNLLVGTTSAASGFKLQVNGGAGNARYTNINTGGSTFDQFRFDGGLIGSITTNGVTTSYNTSSDQRLKENIVDAPSASDDIDAIQVRSFDWKADGSHQKYGMVAQELQGVAPEAVSGDADSEDMMGVDYSKLVPMMLKEIQSLRARVAQLEGEA